MNSACGKGELCEECGGCTTTLVEPLASRMYSSSTLLVVYDTDRVPMPHACILAQSSYYAALCHYTLYSGFPHALCMSLSPFIIIIFSEAFPVHPWHPLLA